jgi:hypothetical protein
LTPTEVLAAVAVRGITLKRVGDRLRLRPANLVTPDLLAAATRIKPAGRAGPPASAPVEAIAEGCEQAAGAGPVDGCPDCESIPIEDVGLCCNCCKIDHWQDGLGNWKCRRCQPPRWSGEALRIAAKRLRAIGRRRQCT